MESRRTSQANTSTSDPGWMFLTVVLVLVLLLIGLPTIIAGFFAQRFLPRWLSWRWSFLFWFVLFTASAFVLYTLYQHGLEQLVARELADYLLAAKHYQSDVGHWPWPALWAATWPVWLRTLPGVGMVGFYLELLSGVRGGQTAQSLVQGERSRERRVARAQQRARKRALRPERLQDEAGGMMVIGVPIDGDEEQE